VPVESESNAECKPAGHSRNRSRGPHVEFSDRRLAMRRILVRGLNRGSLTVAHLRREGGTPHERTAVNRKMTGPMTMFTKVAGER